MTDEPTKEASLLELLWLEAACLIEDTHMTLIEQLSDPQAEWRRSTMLKQLGADLVTCADAAQLVMRRDR